MDHKDIPATARVSAAPIFDHKAVAMGEIISLIREAGSPNELAYDHTPGATGSVWDRLKRLTNTL